MIEEESIEDNYESGSDQASEEDSIEENYGSGSDHQASEEDSIEGSYESGSEQASEEDSIQEENYEESIQESYEAGSDQVSEEESYESGSEQASEDENEFEHSEEASEDYKWSNTNLWLPKSKERASAIPRQTHEQSPSQSWWILPLKHWIIFLLLTRTEMNNDMMIFSCLQIISEKNRREISKYHLFKGTTLFILFANRLNFDLYTCNQIQYVDILNLLYLAHRFNFSCFWIRCLTYFEHS